MLPIEKIERFSWKWFARFKPYCAVACGIVLLFIVQGCWGTSNDNPKVPDKGTHKDGGTGKTDAQKQKELAAKFPPMLNGWTKPAATLILSGEQHGYLEPCGCSETQSGGVSRRADLFKQLKDKKWSVGALDLGGTLRRNRRQSQIKFENIRTALHTMGYQATGVGPEELTLGVDYLVALMPDANAADVQLPFVSANVVFYGTPDFGSPAHFKIITVGDVKIGVTSILGMKYKNKILPEGTNSANQDLLSLIEPTKALPPVIKKLEEEKPDIMVLLSHAPVEETKELIKKFPQFQVVITAGGPDDPAGEPEMIEKTMLLRVGKKGKQVGVLGYYPDDKEKPLRFELIELDMYRFKRTKAMDQIMQNYQDQLRDEGIATKMQPVSHPSGANFMGSKVCSQCHTKAYAKLRTSKHEHAFETLIKGRKGTPKEEVIPRIYDPECLSCHVTGWNPQEVFPYKTGFVNAKETPHLKGQQCENCHGPGSNHVAQEMIWRKDRKKTDTLLTERKKMHKSIATAEKDICMKCHDLENSPKFEFKKYWAEISHPYRD